MIPLPHRQKGGAPQLGARQAYESGPFGVRPDDGDGGQGDEDDQDHDDT